MIAVVQYLLGSPKGGRALAHKIIKVRQQYLTQNCLAKNSPGVEMIDIIKTKQKNNLLNINIKFSVKFV